MPVMMAKNCGEDRTLEPMSNQETTGPAPELIEQFVLAAHGNFARVQELHQQHPDLLNCSYEKFNETALEAAGHMGRRDIADYLLTQGAPLTIYAAAMLGRGEDVARFLQNDPESARRPGVHGFSVLFHAALSGDLEVAEAVLERGGDMGMGPALSGAVSNGRCAMVEWLLAHGAPVNSPDFEGKTPLAVAVATGADDIATVLRQHGGSESA